jgi:hypothetical protein
MEPWVNDNSKLWGVKTWGDWVNPDESKFLKVFTHKNHLNCVQWHIRVPMAQLKLPIQLEMKTNKISAICSEKNFDEGHILRNGFIRYLETKGFSLLDIYGRENFQRFHSYIGPLKDDNKYNGLKQYKYHFACENNSEVNYATEKIWDAILSECLCFYWGCPNLSDYIDPRAFVYLDLTDFEKSCQTVKRAIEEDWWSQRIGVIRKEKEKIINELGFFPMIKKVLRL